MLGLDTVGASRTGVMNTPMVPPQRPAGLTALVRQLKKDDRFTDHPQLPSGQAG